MPVRLLFIFFCSYTLISTGLSFKYYLEARPAEPAAGEAAPTAETSNTESMFERAEEHFFSRRYNTSLALFLKVLEENPEHGRAHSYCGDIYLIQKNYDEAAHHFRIAAEIGPEKHKAEFRLGQIAYLQNNGAAAVEHLNRSLELSADFAPSVFYLGLVAWKLQGNREEAALKWEKYLSLRPQDPQRVGIEEAIRYLRTDVAQPEASEHAPLNLDDLLRTAEPSDNALPLNNPAANQGDQNTDPSNDSNNPEASESAENTNASETGKQDNPTDPASQAELEIARSLKEHPERLDTVLSLARIYSEQGQKQRSLQLLEEASKNSDSPALTAALSRELVQQGRTVEARSLLRKQLRRKDLEVAEKAEPALELARITQPPLRQGPEDSKQPGDGADRNGQDQKKQEQKNESSSPGPSADPDSSSSEADTPSTDAEKNPEQPGADPQPDSEKSSSPPDSGEKPVPGAQPVPGDQPTAQEDFEEALSLLENGGYRYLDGEQRKEYHLIQARRSFQQRQSSRAYAQTLQILKEDPTDKRGLILAAAIAYQSETGTSFEVYEERIRNLYGEDPDMMLALAGLYRSREPERYGSELTRLQKQFPNHPGIGLAFLNNPASESGASEETGPFSPDARIRTLENLLARNPQHPELLSAYIEARLKRGDRQADLLDLLKRVMQTEKKHPGTFPDLQKWLELAPELKARLTPEESSSPPASEKDATDSR